MPQLLCVAGIGEVLMDVFENGHSTLGGAPFNVTYHLHQLIRALSAGQAVFLSAVGPDSWGNSIRAAIQESGISTAFLTTALKPTGSALVFESNGGAGFEIQQDVAWDCIELTPDTAQFARRCDAVVFGSLAQRSPISRASIRQFVSLVPGHRLYDVNLRRNSTNGVAGYSAEIIAASLKLATLVKMNDAELEEVAQLLGLSPQSHDPEQRLRHFCERLRVDYSLSAVAITRGSKGALLFSNGSQFQLPDSDLDQSLVHPVGAGDSFAAGLLYGLIHHWAPEHSLALADLVSSYVVRQVSATPQFTHDLLDKLRTLSHRATPAAAQS